MFDDASFNLGYLDTLSYRDTVLHRLDPRAKLVAVLAFIAAVVSFPKYEIAGLLPFSLFPVIFFSLGNIPVGFIMKKVLVVSSFAVFIGIFNPLIDRQVFTHLLGLPISGGWVSFTSIMLKFLLTITTALLLIATTSFPGICHALQKIGLPAIFVAQLLFLYRYLFVLVEETMKIVRARNMRSFGHKGSGVKSFVSLVGTLFLRTIERAERVYQAMLSRGFTGKIETTKAFRFSPADAAFLLATGTLLYWFRLHDVVGSLGRFSMRLLG